MTWHTEKELKRLQGMVPYCYQYFFDQGMGDDTNFARSYDEFVIVQKSGERVPDLNKIIDADNYIESVDGWDRFDNSFSELLNHKWMYEESKGLKPRILSGIARCIDGSWYVEHEMKNYRAIHGYWFKDKNDCLVDFEVIEPFYEPNWCKIIKILPDRPEHKDWYKDVNELKRLQDMLPPCWRYIFLPNTVYEVDGAVINLSQSVELIRDKYTIRPRDYSDFVSYENGKRIPNYWVIEIADNMLKSPNENPKFEYHDSLIRERNRVYQMFYKPEVFEGIAVSESTVWTIKHKGFTYKSTNGGLPLGSKPRKVKFEILECDYFQKHNIKKCRLI